jgi:hypothetical protein
MKQGIALLFIILLIAVIGGGYGLASFKEGYSSFNLTADNSYPSNVVTGGLLYDTYPSTGRKTTSNNGYHNIWWYYPVFNVGSYAQITNNIRYSRNPDEGDCIGAEFCGALYKEREIASNYVYPLPPVPDTPGVRVGYYRTPVDALLGPQPGPNLELPAF